MQMNMKYFLSCRFAMSQKEIHAFILHMSLRQTQGNLLRNLKQMCANLRGQISKIVEMRFRYNKDMPGIDRLNIHERQADIIFIYFTRRRFGLHDLTENTGCYQLSYPINTESSIAGYFAVLRDLV